MTVNPIPLRAAITEAAFQRQVTDLAELLGWQWVHFRPAQTQRGWRTPVSGPLGRGWPDLVLVRIRDKRLVFAELKSERAPAPSGEQAWVLEQLRALVFNRYVVGPSVGFTALAIPQLEVFVWRPSDWDGICEALR
jgi:hypothetical protein